MTNTEIKDNKLLKREGLYLKLKSAIDIILILITIGVIGYFVRDCLNDEKLPQDLLLKPIYSALFFVPVFLLMNGKLEHIDIIKFCRKFGNKMQLECKEELNPDNSSDCVGKTVIEAKIEKIISSESSLRRCRISLWFFVLFVFIAILAMSGNECAEEQNWEFVLFFIYTFLSLSVCSLVYVHERLLIANSIKYYLNKQQTR